MTATPDLTADHAPIPDAMVARRYFAKFGRIAGYLPAIAAELQADGHLDRAEVRAVGGYVEALARTFRALSLKYLMTGRPGATGSLTFDRHESGFPVAQELLFMANDAAQAEARLRDLPGAGDLKDRMVRQIVGDLTVPHALQFALSRRLYNEALAAGGLFLARNDVRAQWLAEDGRRRRWLLHWAVYDSQVNLTAIYPMLAEDSGRTPLPKDDRRWPAVQAHLASQAPGGLKLLTIARGFDTDFDDLHPTRLRRLHVGPMHSAAFTLQSGPIGAVLAEARAPEGQDWAPVWTLKHLEAEGTVRERSGWFGTVERQVFALDPFVGRGAETGATCTTRWIVLPERPYQVLAEREPPGFRDVGRFVVGSGGRVMRAR